jgi:hypothetical protein
MLPGMGRPVCRSTRQRFQFSLGAVLVVMTIICVLLGVWVGRSHQPHGAVSVTVFIPPNMTQKDAEVKKVLKVLADMQVEATVARQQATGISAMISASSDAQYRVVARAVAGLRSAGVRQTTFSAQP